MNTKVKSFSELRRRINNNIKKNGHRPRGRCLSDIVGTEYKDGWTNALKKVLSILP